MEAQEASGLPVLDFRWQRLSGARASWHSAARYDPSHWLFGDLAYEVVVAVVMQERDLLAHRAPAAA